MNDVSDISQILDQVDRRLGEIRQQIVMIAGETGAPEPPERSTVPEEASVSEAVTASDKPVEPEAPFEPGPPVEPAPETEVEREMEVEAEMEVEPETEVGPEAENEPEAQIEPAMEIEPEPESESETEIEREPPLEPPMEAEPPLDWEPEPPLGMEPEPEAPVADAEPPEPPPAAEQEMDQLLSLRERLLSDARELIRSYEDEVAALESRFGIASPPPLFEGVVTVVATGIGRTQTLVAIEEALLAIEGVVQAFVRHYDRGEGWFEITLDRPVPLTTELAEGLPLPVELRSTTANEIVLSLEGDAS